MIGLGIERQHSAQAYEQFGDVAMSQRISTQKIFEIGRRLKHVKDNGLSHGQFGVWVESIGMNDRMARKFMTIATELGTKRTTSSDIGFEALYLIATLPPDERERPHTVPSTGAVKTVDEMTVRELREVKAALKQAEEKREIVGKAYTELGRELKEAQEALSKHGYGCFREWCEVIGMKKDAVNRLIQRYDLIVANCDELQRELIEDLPVSLSYTITSPSADSTESKRRAKAAVLNGEVKTLRGNASRSGGKLFNAYTLLF